MDRQPGNRSSKGNLMKVLYKILQELKGINSELQRLNSKQQPPRVTSYDTLHPSIEDGNFRNNRGIR